ncbi:MAG: hypothetical protein EAY81_09565 [Bacteroidetes bacterium]|nr:MAG: hypothetical protein EAY81_09565 [Bacteroidota bacterium]
MDILSLIKEWTDDFLSDDLFLVNIEHKEGSHKISLFIDGDSGIDIEACKTLSRHISDKLDELDFGEEPYALEVSSPGADKPLLVKRQYPKHIGREFLVRLKAQTELTGKLEEVTESGILLALKDKKKGYKEATVKAIDFEEIDEATIILSFR